MGVGDLTQAKECGLYSLGMDGKPSKILEQEYNTTKQCLRKINQVIVHMMDMQRLEEGRQFRTLLR